jgi:hypothetical protein
MTAVQPRVPADDRLSNRQISLDLLAALILVPKGVRLLGVTLSALQPDAPDAADQICLAL